MASMGDMSKYEGLATNRAPFFDGSDYVYWKTRMMVFLKCEAEEVWDAVETGPYTPLKTVDGEDIPKPKIEWTPYDKEMVRYNNKAMHILFCALSKTQFNKVQQCSTAHEIWRILEVTYEGTSQVKENKVSLLVHKYELFKMKEGEGIQEMFDRFNDILNGLKALGKSYTNSELVRKILRALPKSWASKKDAIVEAKDLNKLPLEELLGSLLTHEMGLHEDEDQGSKVEKKRGMALKAKAIEESEVDEESESEDEEIAMYAKRFKRFMKRTKPWKKNSKDDQRKEYKKEYKRDPKKESSVICYNCNKPGHIKQECSLLKKSSKFLKKKKGKAMKATWSDSDESSTDEEEEVEEMANLCLMAKEENSSSDDEEVNDLYTFDELQDAFDDLSSKFEKLGFKHIALKRSFSKLEVKVSILEKEKETLIKENNDLKKKAEDSLFIATKLTNGKENLEKLLGSHGQSLSKHGLGYIPFSRRKNSKTVFLKEGNSKNDACSSCGINGHYAFACNMRRYRHIGVKKVWVPKGTIIPNNVSTNQQGPKRIWVPISKV